MMTTMNEFVKEIKRLEALRYSTAFTSKNEEATKAYFDMVDLALSTTIEDALCIPFVVVNKILETDPFLMFDDELIFSRTGVTFCMIRVDNKKEFYQKYLRGTF